LGEFVKFSESIKTIVIFAFVVIAIVVYFPIGIVAFLLSFLGLRKPMAIMVYRMAQAWARVTIILTGCPKTVTGRENNLKKGGLCFVANHVGMFDIILALAYAGRPFGFIAKKELLFLPGINIWISLLGGLFIDRTKPRSALKTINTGIKRLKDGGGMLIFPEGTRSRDGKLAVFHPGSLKLASQSEVPIIPVAITGSYEVFEKQGRVCAVPVSISFLPPVYSSELPPADRKKILADQIHESIAAALPN
jgi:1-acyl-sn-glycerol-3-phosphate acyltransferase